MTLGVVHKLCLQEEVGRWSKNLVIVVCERILWLKRSTKVQILIAARPTVCDYMVSKHGIISQFSFHQMFCYANSFRVSPTFQVAVYYSFMAHKVTTALKVSLLAQPNVFFPISYVDFHGFKQIFAGTC